MAVAGSPSPFMNVDNRELNINDDIHFVYDKVKSLSAHWRSIAFSLRLRADTINNIEANSYGNTFSCLQRVLEYWLKKDYDYKAHGIPCWRMVCEAVKEGGGNPALAEEIAREHSLPVTVEIRGFRASSEQAMSPATSNSTAVNKGGGDSTLADQVAHENPSPATRGMSPYETPNERPLPASEETNEQAMSPVTLAGGSDTEEVSHEYVEPAVTTEQEHIEPASSKDTTIYISSEKNYSTVSKLQDLKKDFYEAIRETKNSFKQKDIPKIIDYLAMHVEALLGPNKAQETTAPAQAVREEFRNIENLEELFTILQDKYISWFNYEIIVELVRVVLSKKKLRVFLGKNRSLKRRWSAYEEKLKDYFINSDGLLKDVDAVEFGITDVSPGTKVMVARVDRDDYTLDDLFFFRRAIPRELDLPHIKIYFHKVCFGCLHLEHLIPDYLYSLLFPLPPKLQQQLASIGITELTCGEYVYHLKEIPAASQDDLKHQNLVSNIDICDPLWYENTSTPLHEACWKGLMDEVQWLIDKFGYSTFHRGLNGWTPLHSASYGGHIEIFRLLIGQDGIDSNEGDDNCVSSLHMASYNGHLPVVQYLVDTCHVPPDQPDSSNNTALLYSAMGGHSDLVEFFIKRNCNASQINSEGASLSLLACKSGQVALVTKLEELNLFSPESTDNYRSTVLHYCCMKNNLELFKHLLTQYKLEIEVKDQFGRTPLHFASWYASSSVVEYIISKHKQGNEALLVTDNEGFSCLHRASDAVMGIEAGIVYSKLLASRDAPFVGVINNTQIKHNIDFIKRNERVKMFSSLLKKASTCPNFNINATTTDGRSLLHCASRTGSTLLVKALQEYPSLNHDGASLVHWAARSGSNSVLGYIISHYNLNANDPDNTGHTPLVYSCSSGSINSVQYLINNHNSDPNITDNNGMTPLHCSCRNGHINITQYFIEVQHCDINKTDNEGHTLVHHAAWSGNFDLVQYLITEQGLSPTAVNKNGSTALHYASQALNLPLVKKLITTYQLDPHQAVSNGRLPIHYAAISGDILLLELYVKTYECSVSVTDNDGWNIVHYSSSKGHTHFIKHIINQYPGYIKLIHSTDNKGRIPLHLACENGNIQLVTFLINAKCDVTAKNTRGSTCVMFACYSGNLDLVQLLIQQYNLDPLSINQYGFSALHAAAQIGHIHILEWYSQEYSVDITSHCDNSKYTLAHYAAYSGKLQCLQQLINKYQCDVNATTAVTGSTVLHRACEGGHVPVVLYLTSLPQCNVAAKTSNGSTVLHITCQSSGSLPILKHLVENHQLDLCAVNDDGMAPIHIACASGRLNLVQYIIEHSSSLIEVPESKLGLTPFLTAVYFNHLEIIQYFISKNCNLSATDNDGYKAVHISSWRGHLSVLKYLIDKNYCNPNITDHQDRTPLHVAVVADQFEILEYLLDSEACINVQDKDGNTPLHLACGRGQQKMVSLISSAYLSTNNSILVVNKKGQTPLHLAAAAGHKDSAEALLHEFTGSSTHHDLLTARDNEGCTVFHTACSNGHLGVFRYLCRVYSEGVTSLDNRRHGLLHAACEGGNIEIVKELVEKYKLDPESQDKDGITCLHLLAGERNILEAQRINIYQYLRHHIDSNPTPKDKSGRTPLHYASGSGNIHMSRYLIKSFTCRPDDPDYNGYTSVHAACEAGNMELVQYYLTNTDLKCDAYIETNDFKTILYYASKSSDLELVKFLVDVFSLKPRPHDIEVAQSVNPDSSVVKYLQEVYEKVTFEEWEKERRSKGYREKLAEQQIDPQRHDVS